jgi:tetratricopeptide (TPR) repeat protein
LGAFPYALTAGQAQEEPQRYSLVALIDSVDRLRTVMATDAFPSKWSDKQPSGMNELRRGILAWHKGRLSGERKYYEDAVDQFTRATKRSAAWPYPWYLLSRLRFEMLIEAFPVAGVTTQRGAAYRRYYEQGFLALDKTFEADASFPPAVRFVTEYGPWLEWLRSEPVAEALNGAWAEEVSMVLAQGPPGPEWTPPAIVLTVPGELPPARRALEALRDSLGRMTSTAAVRSVPKRWDAELTFFDPQWGALRLGFIELRVGELASDSAAYRQAVRYFESAKTLAPTEPYAWYGIGQSHLGLRALAMQDRATVEPEAGYQTYYEPAMGALQRSLDMDPGFLPTLHLLLAMAIQEDNRFQPSWVMEAIARINQLSPEPNPQVFLLQGRQRRNTGDPMAGLAAFEQYVQTGGDIGVAALELARTLADLKEIEGARQAYLTGLDHFTLEARTAYRRDLTWVAEFYELDEFDRLDTEALPNWIHWFWRKRDAASVRAEGDRLREHLRRWSFINRSFRVTAPQARAHINPPLMVSFQACTQDIDRMTLDDLGSDTPTRPADFRGWEPIYDHRAAIHMRHGFPARRVWKILGTEDSIVASTAPAAPLNPQTFGRDPRLIRQTPLERDNPFGLEDPSGPGGGGWRETWLYFFAGSPRMVNFQDSRALGPGATTMVAVIPLTPRYLDALSVFGSAMGRDFARVRLDATARQEGLQRSAVSGRCSMAGQRVQQTAAVDFEVAAETDSYTLLFPSNLYPTVHAFGMPAPTAGGGGRIVVTYALDPAHLRDDRTGALPNLPLRIRITAIDALTQQVVHRDTLHSVPAVTESGPIAGVVEVMAPAGTYDVRVAVQLADSASGNVVALGNAVEVWSPDPAVRLSDLVTGGSASDVLWWFGNEPVPINPLEAFPRATTVEVFYVQSGLRVGATYETRITLSPEDADDPVLSVSFAEVAAQALETKRRGLGLGDVAPGRYRLTVSIQEEGSPNAVDRIRTIDVTE